MSHISPDGAWLWDGRQWVPNLVPQPANLGQEARPPVGSGSHQAHGSSPQADQGSSWSGLSAAGQWPVSAPPRPVTPAEELNAAAWSHYGPLIVAGVAMLLALSIVGSVLAWIGIFAFVIPLAIRQSQGQRSRYVNAHATESLNFQLTWLLITAAAVALSVIPAMLTFGLIYLLLLPVALGFSIFMIVVMIKAGSAAKSGSFYRYPLTYRFLPDA